MFFNAKNRFLETFKPKRSYSRSRQGHLKVKRSGSPTMEIASRRHKWPQQEL